MSKKRRKFGELREKLYRDNPEAKERGREYGKAYDEIIYLAALGRMRQASGMTQSSVAEILGVSQPNVSKIEKSADIHLSTLSAYVNALGGRLEIRAVFEDDSVDFGIPDGKTLKFFEMACPEREEREEPSLSRSTAASTEVG